MGRPVIAIDVDITTLASDILWWEWLQQMTGTSQPTLETFKASQLSQNRQVDYNLAKYFPDPINKRVSPVDFWREEGLYNLVKPVQGSVDAITELSAWFDVVFVTHCKRNHSRSKYNCLERYFGHIPFDYVVTKEKYRVDADAIIDDRNEFLNQFLNKGKLAVKLSTPYTQNVEIDAKGMEYNFVECKDWFEIKNAILSSFPF